MNLDGETAQVSEYEDRDRMEALVVSSWRACDVGWKHITYTFLQGDAAFLHCHLLLTECDNLLYIEHVKNVTADTTSMFGPVWHLQGNERAARCHGGHHYEVVEGCASPGRRGSDLFHRVDGYRVCQAFANKEGSVCVATGEGRIAGLCILHRVWQPVEQWQWRG
jgi:hypothetical protein